MGRHIIHYISEVRKRLRWQYFFLALSLILFVVNGSYVSYPDEFVNILAGKAILEGKIPYRDFFDHHLPGAWYLASFLLLFSFGSYVKFRFLFAVFCWAVLGGLYVYFQRRHKQLTPYFLGFMTMYPLLTVYYWTHLFIADALSSLFFSAILWLLVAETTQSKPHLPALYALSGLTFLFVFSSLTYVYVAAVVYGWILWLSLRAAHKTGQHLIKILGFMIAPYVLYGIFLLITNSFREFYISNVEYNTKLYMHVPNYTPGRFFNPIKFALTLIHNFYQTYLPLLVRMKELNLYFPVDIASALSVFMFIFFAFRLHILTGIFSFFILSFSAPRSNLMKIGETDYQSGLFLTFGLVALFIVLYRHKQEQITDKLLSSLSGFFVGATCIFSLFGIFFLAKNTYDKWFLRYSQAMPGITNHAPIAFFVDELIQKDDYYFIGPYEPHEEFFVKKGQLPGKYPTLLPQFREDTYFKDGFIEQFEKTSPRLIIFKNSASIFMTPATEFGAFFVDWMKSRYVRIADMKGYIVEKDPTNLEISKDVYMRKDSATDILKRMEELGYIRSEKK